MLTIGIRPVISAGRSRSYYVSSDKIKDGQTVF
jgi:hypothetical protein